jgi:hypothetical protein
MIQRYPGKIHVRTELNTKFGEFHFYVSIAYGGSFEGKCLYDVLSNAGIKMDRAKVIVQDVAKQLNRQGFHDVELTDYKSYDAAAEKVRAARIAEENKSVS